MFQNCKSLTSLDVTNLKEEQLKNIDEMFYGCSAQLIQSIKNQKNIL